MKIIALMGISLALATGSAFAANSPELTDEGKVFKDRCVAYQAEHGGSSDCGCLAMKVQEDPDFATALAQVVSPETLEAASDDTKAAIKACAPQKDS